MAVVAVAVCRSEDGCSSREVPEVSLRPTCAAVSCFLSLAVDHLLVDILLLPVSALKFV